MDRKKAVWLSLMGFVLGAGLGALFFALVGADAYLAQAEHRGALVLYLAASGLYGAVNMGTSVVYDMEDWSILRCTATHFALSVSSSVLFFGGMILLGWMGLPPLGWGLVLLGAYVFVYCLIWLLQYLAYRSRVKKMNARLRQWRAHRHF